MRINELEETFVVRNDHTYQPSTIISTKSTKPIASKSRNYVDKEAFYKLLKERQELLKENPNLRISNEIAATVKAICEGLGGKYNFANLPFRDDMVCSAILKCLSKIDKFDCNYTDNPFSYFTQITYFEFLEVIKSEKKQKYIKCKATMDALHNNLFLEDSEIENASNEILSSMSFTEDEDIGKFIADFELTAKRKPKEVVIND